MSRPATTSGCGTKKTPRRLARRWCGLRPAWLRVAFRRSSVPPVMVSFQSGRRWRSSRTAALASNSAWLNPRCFRFARVERNRNDKHVAQIRTRVVFQFENGVSQDTAQPLRDWQNAVIFQRMDQRPQRPGIASISNRSLKRRRRKPAWLAKPVRRARFQTPDVGKGRNSQVFAASRTNQSRLRGNAVPAIIANGGAAKPQERVAADTARGGEQHRTYIVEWTSKRIREGGRPTSQVAYHGAPCRGLG